MGVGIRTATGELPGVTTRTACGGGAAGGKLTACMMSVRAGLDGSGAGCCRCEPPPLPEFAFFCLGSSDTRLPYLGRRRLGAAGPGVPAKARPDATKRDIPRSFDIVGIVEP